MEDEDEGVIEDEDEDVFNMMLKLLLIFDRSGLCFFFIDLDFNYEFDNAAEKVVCMCKSSPEEFIV